MQSSYSRFEDEEQGAVSASPKSRSIRLSNMDNRNSRISYGSSISGDSERLSRKGRRSERLTLNESVRKSNLSLKDVKALATDRASKSVMSNLFSSPPRPSEPLMGAQDALDKTDNEDQYVEHKWSINELSQKLNTRINAFNVPKSDGLSSIQASELLAACGPNSITPPAKTPLWILFLVQFTNMLMVLLEVSGTLCIILFVIDPSNLTNLYLGI